MHNCQYLQIAQEIERRIRDGVYLPDTQLPPRVRLVEEFGVARATIERTMNHLINNGVLRARHGSGTFINDPNQFRRNIAVVDWGNSVVRNSAFRCEFFTYMDLQQKSRRKELMKFNGLVWMSPEQDVMDGIITPLIGKLPQVLVNRTLENVSCVSTDHFGAYKQITRERLELFPQAQPYFVKSNVTVTHYRESGFVDACRELGRFYDMLYLPDDFEAKLDVLNAAKWSGKSPLLLISDSINHTGAVAWWVRRKGYQWQKDIFYSDFDNDMKSDIWGVEVTSYLQNIWQLFEAGVKKLDQIVAAGEDDAEHIMVFPQRKNGMT